MIFDYDLLLKRIDAKYSAAKFEYKIMKFCKEVKIKIYKFKQVINNHSYFLTDEMYRIIDVLDIKDNEIRDYFMKIKNA